VKHLVDQRLLVAEGYILEAKMRRLVGPIHPLFSGARP
jgi:hypothetical protein